MPPADQVRDMLERVLASDAFARSERARDLLRYVVEQELAGNAERLKGFSIAVDVFGKGDGFDPSTDTVVRVQAGRLRDLLDQYYAGEGGNEPLRIAIPRGSYVPEYQLADAPAPADAADEAVPPPAALVVRRSRLPAALGLCLAALLLGLVSWHVFGPPVPGMAEIAATGTVPAGDEDGLATSPNMLPAAFIRLEAEGSDVTRVASALRRGLAGFDTVDFIARAHDQDGAQAQRGLDFVFVVKEASAPGHVHLELQEVPSGRVLLALDLAVAGRDQAAVDDDIADLLTTVAPTSGMIYASLAERGIETPLIRCLVLNDGFYGSQTEPNHRAAYECLERLADAGVRSPLIHSELASLHVQALTNGYEYPPEISGTHALELARTGVRMGPNSPYAHRAMGYVLSRTVNVEESIRWTRKAYELNVFDLSMAASFGYALIFAGEYKQGVPVLLRAVAAASAHPPWWDYGLFLGQFMLGDMQAAALTVTALAASRRAHYIAARLIVADALGERGKAASLLADLQSGHSVFAADPEAFFRRGNYPGDMTFRLVEALRGAGLLGAT